MSPAREEEIETKQREKRKRPQADGKKSTSVNESQFLSKVKTTIRCEAALTMVTPGSRKAFFAQIRIIHSLTLYSDKKGTIPVFSRKNLIAYDSLGTRRLGDNQNLENTEHAEIFWPAFYQ